MGARIWNIVVLVVFSSYVRGHVYKDYTNNAVLLSSVYDAMKNNLQDDIRNNLNRDDVLSDMRNKRNVNEKVEYYDAMPSDSLAEYVIPIFNLIILPFQLIENENAVKMNKNKMEKSVCVIVPWRTSEVENIFR